MAEWGSYSLLCLQITSTGSDVFSPNFSTSHSSRPDDLNTVWFGLQAVRNKVFKVNSTSILLRFGPIWIPDLEAIRASRKIQVSIATLLKPRDQPHHRVWPGDVAAVKTVQYVRLQMDSFRSLVIIICWRISVIVPGNPPTSTKMETSIFFLNSVNFSRTLYINKH